MRLLPLRQKKTEPIGPIVDLDAIVSDPTPFRFKGKIHIIKPISFKEFLKFTASQSNFVSTLNSNTQVTPDQLADGYHQIISAVCDTITIQDIKDMEQAQIGALYQLILDVVTGSVQTGDRVDDGKKKRFRLPIYESSQLGSLPNALESSDGVTSKS